ncbi:hypothetical protein D1007_58943 [Hordeum vulgare]|nr:hypothetical protein D1007_58943 [Hordeum vulgare]
MVASYAYVTWGPCVPSRVKFFCWLMVQRAGLEALPGRRGCRLSAVPDSLGNSGSYVVWLPFALCFWGSVNVDIDGVSVRDMASLASAAAVAVDSGVEFALMCCWHMWKHRNAVVFQCQLSSLSRVHCCCREDDMLWRERVLAARRHDPGTWLSVLSP